MEEQLDFTHIIEQLDISEDFSDMLLSVLAHDIRQPFASLIMTADMIKHTRRSLSQKELNALFEDIRITASKSIELMDGLLCWMKSKKPGLPHRTQFLLLNDLIHEANSLYLYDQLSKSISIYNVIPEKQLIKANKQMLQFINRNILSNATKYSIPGGIITVKCRIENDWITVSFTDQGEGMTAKEIESLFNINPKEKKNSHYLKSAGIALNICQDMILLMNGRLWAESVPGVGSTFYYSLPILEN